MSWHADPDADQYKDKVKQKIHTTGVSKNNNKNLLRGQGVQTCGCMDVLHVHADTDGEWGGLANGRVACGCG